MTIVNATSKVVTLNLTEETKVIFPHTFSSIAIRSENNVGISEYSGKQLGDSGVLRCNEGESILYPTLVPKNFIYLIGTGKVEIFVGNNLNVNPFKNGGRGGDDIVHYIGITTTPLYENATINPILINGVETYAKNAYWAVYNSIDYIFNGTIWQEFMDMSKYYTKTETDNLLNVKANAADVYTKSETYTQTEINTALALKANAADTYTKAQSDNKFIAQTSIQTEPTTADINNAINTIWGS